MIKENAYSFIHIGLMLRYMTSLSAKTKISTYADGLKTLREITEDAGLHVSVVACDSIIKEFEKKSASKSLTDEIGTDIDTIISTKVRSLENTVFAESSTKLVYLIPNRKYNGTYLLSEPEKLLSDSSYDKLTDLAKYDFRHSCKCLLYGEATASAFHVLRATEEVLKQYYFNYIKTKRLKVPMWGPMTDQLKKKKNNKPNSTVLASLDMVRTSYRNPTQHPEATYSIDSAESLFGLCVDVINQMTKEL